MLIQGMKIHIKRRNKEFGIKRKKILFGKKINKIIKLENKIKVKKLIKNGKRNRNSIFPKLDNSKINNKWARPLKIGLNAANLDMDGERIKQEKLVEKD